MKAVLETTEKRNEKAGCLATPGTATECGGSTEGKLALDRVKREG